jgi:hypothetical protein
MKFDKKYLTLAALVMMAMIIGIVIAQGKEMAMTTPPVYVQSQAQCPVEYRMTKEEVRQQMSRWTLNTSPIVYPADKVPKFFKWWFSDEAIGNRAIPSWIVHIKEIYLSKNLNGTPIPVYGLRGISVRPGDYLMYLRTEHGCVRSGFMRKNKFQQWLDYDAGVEPKEGRDA